MVAHNSALVRVASDGTLEIKTAELDVPQNSYVADVAWIRHRRGAVSLYFGKLAGDDNRLLSRVEVKYSYEAFVNGLWHNSREFHRLMKERGTLRRGLKIEAETVDASTLAVEKEHSLWSNLDVISRNGNEAVIDFFYMAPRCMVLFNQTHDLNSITVEPVLRVMLTTDEVLRMLDAGEPIVAQLRPHIEHKEAL